MSERTGVCVSCLLCTGEVFLEDSKVTTIDNDCGAADAAAATAADDGTTTTETISSSRDGGLGLGIDMPKRRNEASGALMWHIYIIAKGLSQ
uniref:Uncharacterized protein n=1 Tax=Syphacia muris TaxID=451379 RepID=A0A0N5ADQ7_9BILA